MKLKLKERTIDINDIEECQNINPFEHHIKDMKPFLYIKLKTGEKLFVEEHVKILKNNK